MRIAHKHGAALAVDDAHSLGVLGPKGEGTAAHFGMTDEVDIIAGTFSKSLASIGGFVASTESVIHYLRHHCRPLIFTASLPPSNTAGVIAALEVLRSEPERRESLWANTRRLHAGFRQLGFDIGPSETPILPVLIGPLEKTFIMWRKLFDAGVFTNPVAPPAVAAVAVPPPHQRHGHAYLRPDRLLSGAVRAHRPRAGRHLTQVTVRPARSRRDLKSFIDLPYQLFAGDPVWVPPLRLDIEMTLSRTKNPFFEHAEAEYFLAERDGTVVGRIAAIENRLHNETHADRVGFYGWFDCIDDQEVANALFRAAETWLRARKLDVMRGPASFSTNDQCGLLVDGFETRPTLLMPHNPPYYVRAHRAGRVHQGEGPARLPGRRRRGVRAGAGAAGARHRAHPAAPGHHAAARST